MSENTSTATFDVALRPNEAGNFLGVPEKTLANWRNRGKGPAFSRLSHNLVVYRLSDLEAFLASHRIEFGGRS